MIFQVKRFFRENLEEKLLALIVMLVIWAVVISRTEETKTLEVGINLIAGDERIVLSNPVESVRVQATGSRFDFARIDDSMLEVMIDLREKEPGKAISYLDSDKLPFSQFLKVTRVYPNEIVYTTARRISKKLKVEPYLDGQPKVGYKISKVEVSPEFVELSGAEQLLGEMDAISTKKIQLTGLSADKNVVSELLFQSKSMRMAQGENEVSVRIEVERDVREFVFKKVPVHLDDGSSAEISPSSLTIRLKGPVDELERLKKEGLILYVEAKAKRIYTVEKYYLKKLPPSVQPVKLPRLKIKVIKR